MNREDIQKYVGCNVRITYRTHKKSVHRFGLIRRVYYRSAIVETQKITGNVYTVPIGSITSIRRV